MWRSVPLMLKDHEAWEARQWRSDYDSLEAMMGSRGQGAHCRKHGGELTTGTRGGGFPETSEEFNQVQAGLARRGRLAATVEEML